MLVAEGGFEATLSLVNPTKKGQINGINILMLIDTLASNSFMTPRCGKRVKVEVADTASSVKINFAQGSCQAAQVRKKSAIQGEWSEVQRELHDLRARRRKFYVKKYNFTLLWGGS